MTTMATILAPTIRRVHEAELPPQWGEYQRSLIVRGHRPRVLSVNDLAGKAKEWLGTYRGSRDVVVEWAERVLGVTAGLALVATRSEPEAPEPRWCRVWCDRYTGRPVQLVWADRPIRRRYSALYPSRAQIDALARRWERVWVAMQSGETLAGESYEGSIAAWARKLGGSEVEAMAMVERVALELFNPSLAEARCWAVNLTTEPLHEYGGVDGILIAARVRLRDDRRAANRARREQRIAGAVTWPAAEREVRAAHGPSN